MKCKKKSQGTLPIPETHPNSSFPSHPWQLSEHIQGLILQQYLMVENLWTRNEHIKLETASSAQTQKMKSGEDLKNILFDKIQDFPGYWETL